MKILVVDDDPVTATLLEKLLTKQGYEVTRAANGVQALEALRKTIFRIILTDWMMPEMDGPTLCRHIREMTTTYYIYIILLTSKDSKDDAVAGLEAGADDYIVKPFNKPELLARMRAGNRLIELEDRNRETLLKLSRSERMAAVGHLAAGIAHEINNPIGFINSNLTTLGAYIRDIAGMLASYRDLAQTLDRSVTRNRMHPDLPKMLRQSIRFEKEYEIEFLIEDTQSLISDCQGGSERIKAIVHEMRYFRHPDRHSIERCYLGPVLQRVAARFAGDPSVEINIAESVESLPHIECNIPHIEQVFTNLITNALEAIGQDGKISLDGRRAEAMVEIMVSDNGRGIPEENRSKIFDPFFTTKTVGQGVGLGLTSALNIVKMHNGNILVDSRQGDQTCFTVRLPLPKPEH